MIDLAEGYDIAVTEIDGFAHPLSAIYRRTALPHAEAFWPKTSSESRICSSRVRTRRVPTSEMITVDPELQTLRNLNTKEDYAAALAAAGLTASAPTGD
jgi:molybdopterin-guanine dinucleotide biosynthesis protein A